MDANTKVKCQIHRGEEILVSDAFVPIAALIAYQAGRSATPAMLLDRAVCKRATHLEKMKSIPFRPYLVVLAHIEKRANEKRAASYFAARFRLVRNRAATDAKVIAAKTETMVAPLPIPVPEPAMATTCYVEGELVMLAETKPVVLRR